MPKRTECRETLQNHSKRPRIEEGNNNFATRQDKIYHEFGIREINPPSSNTRFDYPKGFSSETRQAYAFTNEDLGSSMDKLDLKGKKVACISGSADFVINALMFGAKLVDAVDISPVACFLGELKLAGLSQLDYEEFLDFFDTSRDTFGPQSFLYEQYVRLQPHISNEAKYFFDKLIASGGNSDFLSPGGMIIDKVKNMNSIKKINPYLQSEGNYNKAKKALKKPVSFYPQGMKEFLDQHKNSNYEIIYISNIFDYPPYMNKLDTEKCTDYDEIRSLKQSAENVLAAGGELLYYHFGKNSNCGFRELLKKE
jgi:hypothetical protein